MNTYKICIALGLSLSVSAAIAQSGVTLYGRVNQDIEYLSDIPAANGSSTSRISDHGGDWGTSLLGLQGVEDIGGGTKILFHLENGFNSATGQQGDSVSFFQRWATVGAGNASWGTVLLGRELFISNGVWDFDPFGQSAWSSASLVRGRNWPQSSNNISYQSPKIGGLEIYGQYSLSNATNWNGNNTTAQGRSDGLQITYSSAWFQLRGLYDETRNPANGQLDDVFQYSQEYFAGVNVFLGPVKLQAVYQTSHASVNSNSVPTSTRQVWGGITWQATPSASLIAAAYHVNANNGAGNATIYTAGGTYSISKRTLLDIQAATVRDSWAGTFGLEANLPGNADNPFSGHSQSGAYAGIQHNF